MGHSMEGMGIRLEVGWVLEQFVFLDVLACHVLQLKAGEQNPKRRGGWRMICGARGTWHVTSSTTRAHSGTGCSLR